MPRSPLQSDFVVHHEQPPAEQLVQLPPSAGVIDLPRAIVETTQASARSTKIVMTFTWVMLVILALICAIGPHIPSGE